MKNHALALSVLGIVSLVFASGCGSSSNTSVTDANKLGGSSSIGGTGNTGIGTNGGSSTTVLGGTSSSGGNQGTGGTSVPAATGTLGQSCSPAGTLACNGINQRLTLVCGASGKWETNQTCNVATQVCDARPGGTQGTCQEQDPDCATLGPGARFCSGTSAATCDAWGLSATRVTCLTGVCADGKCIDSTGCSTASNFLSCSSDCPSVLDPSSRCKSDGYVDLTGLPSNGPKDSAIVHLSYANAVAPDNISGCATRRYFTIFPMGDYRGYTVARVASPWLVVTNEMLTQCSSVALVATCLWDMTIPFTVYTDDPNAPPVNVFIESSTSVALTCP